MVAAVRLLETELNLTVATLTLAFHLGPPDGGPTHLHAFCSFTVYYNYFWGKKKVFPDYGNVFNIMFT